MTDKLKQLEDIVKVLDKDTVTQQEFVEVFGILIDFVAQIKDENDLNREQLTSQVSQTLQKALSKLESFSATELANIKEYVSTLKNGEDYILTDRDMEEIASKIDVPVVEKVIEKTETIKEVVDTPEKIRDKLETLKDDDRLDASAIKGLSKREKKLSEDLINRAIGIIDQRSSYLINNTTQLRTDVNMKITGWGTHNIYVQATAPPNPSLLDLWVDIS